MIWPICKKEMKTYFVSPIAYILIAVFLGISGYFFAIISCYWKIASLEAPLWNMGVILLFISPLLTMRLLAEEKRQQTMELLLTSPIKVYQLVLGKYCGALLLYLIAITLTFPFPLFLKLYGNPEMGPILSGYLGLFIMSASFVSIGLFASSLSENQIVAAILSFAMLLFLWIIRWAEETVGGIWREVLENLSFFNHYENLQKGVIDSVDIFFYLAIIFTFLFLTVRVIESRRWR